MLQGSWGMHPRFALTLSIPGAVSRFFEGLLLMSHSSPLVREKTSIPLATLAVLALASPLAAESLVCNFTDTKGKPLRNVEARILLQYSQESQEDLVLYAKTDNKGCLEFENLVPGSYLLQAQRNRYMPLKIKVDIPREDSIERTLLSEKEFRKLEDEAVEALEQAKFQAAIDVLNKLKGYYPLDATVHDNLARAYAGVSDEKRAIEEANIAAKLDPKYATTREEVQAVLFRNLGEQALKERDFKTAVARFEALREIDPDNYEAYHGLALAYGHLGRMDEAIEAIDRAIELAPGNSDLVLIKQAIEINAGKR